jgi:glyoxylase-like metal-dependent hydrolase (beta-lactamase superfamily II)
VPCRAAPRLAVLFVGCLAPSAVAGQASHFNADLISQVRRAATLIPGAPPIDVRYVVLNPDRMPVADLVEGSSKDTVDIGFTVPSRFPRGWIVVDAAVDRTFVPKSASFSDITYQQIHTALRGAKLAVVTHEHWDHVAGVLASPYLPEVQAHTLLTRAQVASLTNSNDPKINIDSATGARYLVTDYDPIMPIAPGVVLIKAPGHSPGSQIVYVRTASGSELILAGDVAWSMAGILGEAQKPEAETKSFGGERRESIAARLRWLHQLGPSGPTVVVAHDINWIRALTTQRTLITGFDFSNP